MGACSRFMKTNISSLWKTFRRDEYDEKVWSLFITEDDGLLFNCQLKDIFNVEVFVIDIVINILQAREGNGVFVNEDVRHLVIHIRFGTVDPLKSCFPEEFLEFSVLFFCYDNLGVAEELFDFLFGFYVAHNLKLLSCFNYQISFTIWPNL